jgi:uncharacterized protein YigA (DUF484 family)
MNTESINWNLSGLAGHDKHGNEISVRELVAAIEGFQAIERIATLSHSMRDSLARQAAENYRIKQQNESLQRTISTQEHALNHAHSRISSMLSEQADIDQDVAIKVLSIYANPKNWANPRNQHGDIKAEQRSVFIKGFHGYETAMAAINSLNKEQAA